jgi:hypothetical protein
MPATDPTGTLADVYAARRALHAKFEPPLLFYASWAGGFALLCGSRSVPVQLVAAGALAAASAAATWWQYRRTRLIQPRRIRLFSPHVFLLVSLLSLLAMVIVVAVAGVLLAALLHHWTFVAITPHRGTVMAYLVPLVVFSVPVIAALALPWRLDPYGIDARSMRKTPDQPVALDPTIEPRQTITVCAMLAACDWIEAGLLAGLVHVSEAELRRQTAELVAAQHIDLHLFDGRWWFGLTAVGRATYRRHLRALQRVSGGRPRPAGGARLSGEAVVVEVETAAAPVRLEGGRRP